VPAPQRYAAPHEQILVLAIEARREGVPFEEFWQRAVRPNSTEKLITTKTVEPPPDAVVWPYDSADRNLAIGATAAVKENWRRAYERQEPTRGELAFAALWEILRGQPSGSEVGGAVLSAAA